MTGIEQLAPKTNDLLDEEALIREARVLAWCRRRRRGLVVIALVAAACLIAVGVDRFSSGTASYGRNAGSTSSAVTCPSARVKLLGVTDISGAAVYGGALVRASVTSTVACSMSGYPVVGAQLTSHSTATARDVRDTYLGGGIRTTAPLPRLSITSLPQVVSFTIQFVVGNGPVCPQVNTINITLPGSREVLTARPIFKAGGLALPTRYIYCGALQVTPLVRGPSGTAR
jgi:hypothetical protein